MEEQNKIAALEAVLFTIGDSVEVGKLAEVIGEDVRTTKKLLARLQERYEKEDSGIMLSVLENAYQLCSKPAYYESLIKVVKAPRKYILTDALLETLSIIAYKQPITKSEIEKIRGVSSDHAVSKLVEYSLVTELGRLDAPGRPMLFGTTEEFLRSFGVSSIDELPTPTTDQMETFKQEAEQEIKLDVGGE